MKKTAFATSHRIAALTLIAASLLTASCNKADDNASQEATATVAANDSTVATTGAPSSLNVRYVDMDSIQANYNLAKDLNELYMRSLSKMEQTQQSKQAELQKFGSQIEQKMKSNQYLTEESYNADMNKFSKMQQNAQKQLADLQSATEKELADQQQELTKTVEAFIKEYNKTKGYDMILYKQSGLFFNPALDITKEVVDGLNADYNKVKAEKK